MPILFGLVIQNSDWSWICQKSDLGIIPFWQTDRIGYFMSGPEGQYDWLDKPTEIIFKETKHIHNSKCICEFGWHITG